MASRDRVWQKEWEPMPWDHRRRTASTETSVATYDRQEEKMRNKRESRMRRYREYQVFYYGTPAEREARKKQFSKVLEEQVNKVEIPQMQFVRTVEESKKAAEEDRASQQQQQEEDRKHKDFLTIFRNDNKMLIELQAEQRRAQRKAELNKDKDLLRWNPINWSHSLW